MITSVVSFRGGSGKSSFSLNLTHALVHKLKHRTLLVEADFLAPSYHYLSPSIAATWNDYLLNIIPNYKVSFTADSIDIICTSNVDKQIFNQLHNESLWSTTISDQLALFLSRASESYDTVIFDNQGGLFYSSLVHSFFSDFVICMIRPDYSDVVSTVEYLKKLKRPFYIVWNNLIRIEKISVIIEKWMSKFFEPLENYRGVLGYIPFDEESAYQKWVNQKFFTKGTQYYDIIISIAERLIELEG